MALRETLTDAMKTALKAGETERLSAIRLILAKLKDTEINARGTGKTIEDADILLMLRGMIKPRQEAIALYRQGNRPELAEKEEAEIRVIEGFLPAGLSEQQTTAAVDAAIASTGASSLRDMGKVMAALKAEHGAALDMAQTGALVKTRLAG
ncbi:MULTISPECIES: GatB/YqeY domain-containing protein [unclassified Acidisoma]|jgi:uncharacterized protein YqeY|uniref:GatB/YqeY domain-containing protein n=1 Tax=unclassified Acidisoma TaxID=2634065 RepID=UPI00131B0352|nr:MULTISPECIES: GatB/YqeY domain-containing protein [unclassified Acidisoma]